MVASTRGTRAGRGWSYPENTLIGSLRENTARLHREAERSGIIARLLNGTATVRQYALLLRNLLPVYEAMESQLQRLPGRYPYTLVGDPRLFRCSALIDDLECFWGPTWPLLPEGLTSREYAKRLVDPDILDGCRIAGHAYTRYLGDLSGGQILQRVLHRQLGLEARQTRFYEFDLPGGTGSFKSKFIDALNEIPGIWQRAIVGEAIAAFKLNIRLSDEILLLDQSDVPDPSLLPAS